MGDTMNENTVKKLALIIAANCLTHENEEHDFLTEPSESARKAFNKQVSDRLYTFLLYLLSKSSSEYSLLMNELAKKFPEDWPLPDLDPGFVSIVQQTSHDQTGLIH